jgi:hypothetical protein
MNPSVGFFRLKETEMLRPQFTHNSRAFYSLINDRAYPRAAGSFLGYLCSVVTAEVVGGAVCARMQQAVGCAAR